MATGASWTESFRLIRKAITSTPGRTVHLVLLNTKADNLWFAKFCKLIGVGSVYCKRKNTVCWFCFQILSLSDIEYARVVCVTVFQGLTKCRGEKLFVLVFLAYRNYFS